MLKVFPLTSSDITECLAYAKEEPYGAVREDLRHGIALSLFHNVNRSKGAAPTAWYDWLPNADMPAKAREALEERIREALKKEKAANDAEAQAEQAIAVFKAFNARWAKPKGK